ncbi:FAD/NAD(P)-binding protein [Sphaerisporangium corydalis]|uniref:FAD/NAD(P)-binding protein n=1 Tax=Sphaerisporangium corydalis TaxID=1441875 RepID=A0ABV9E5R0_9ACTN|nr:FAD/NAD(P)-binding protein [Sphaerisporangium corydalis]
MTGSGSVCVVGAGPAGSRLVDRICANASELLGRRVLDVHVVDPSPAAAGPQGPVPRPSGTRVQVHRARAVDLAGRVVLLDDGTCLPADAVVLAQQHIEVLATPREQELGDFARRHGLYYRPPGGQGSPSLDHVPGGENVLVRGLGTVLFDMLDAFTSGRGGRFRRGPGGEPVYLPSGDEPLVHVGSRRGVPHHAMSEYALRAGPVPAPRFVTALAGRPEDFRREVWPLVAKDLAFAYYHELLTAHPERTRMTWASFAEAYAAEEWDGKPMRALIRRAVPRHGDRLDLARLDRPLGGIRFGDLPGLQRWTHGYLAADLSRRADPAHSADLAMVHALRGVLDALAGRVPGDPWFQGFADHVASGPAAARVAELRALARAGIVTFLGMDLRVEPHEAGVWRATTPTVPAPVTARSFVDARWPEPSVSRTGDPLVRRLHARGECAEESGLLKVRLPDRRIVDHTGAVHPRRFAFGPLATGAGGTALPWGADATLARHADSLARTLLTDTFPRIAQVA